MTAWIANARLNLFGPRPPSLLADAEALGALQRFGAQLPAAIANLQRLLATPRPTP